MNFLLVLDSSERSNWSDLLGIAIDRLDSTFELAKTPEEAAKFLEGNTQYNEVIFGSFGGVKNGRYREILEATRRFKNIKCTLLSGDLSASDVELELQELRDQGVGFIDKGGNFDIGDFVKERQAGGPSSIEGGLRE